MLNVRDRAGGGEGFRVAVEEISVFGEAAGAESRMEQ